MITFDNVYKSYGRQDIITNGSFHVSAGDRVGLVGPNGAGKSTLFNLIMGAEEPDKGAVHRTKGLTMGHLPQEVGDIGAEPLLDMVMAVAGDINRIEEELAVVALELDATESEQELENLTRRQGRLMELFEGLDGYTLKNRAEKILAGLGFTEASLTRPVDELSGGWRMRALLARILLADPDLILLDEPTNHLDLSSMIWLENYLRELTATVIIVSHDRAFLNRTVSRIIELENAALTTFGGNYDAYRVERAQRLAHLESAWRAQQEKIRQMRLFIDKNRSRKDRAAQVQARLKALDKMELIELPSRQAEVHFSFPEPGRPPAVLIELEDISLSYDGRRKVYSGLTARVERGQSIALLGPNGAGKSTLLKLLAGALEPDSGHRRVPGSVGIAYYAQHQLDQLHPAMTVIEELMGVSGQATQTQLRTILGNFLFIGDDVFKKVSVLSGGEKARLALSKILFSGANVLLLDEPTNHLDIPSRIALEEALKQWPGELVLITHDRRLINAVASTIWEVSPGGGVQAFPGNLDDYTSTWARPEVRQGRAEPGREETSAEEKAPAKARRDKDRKRREAELRQELHRRTKGLKDKLARLEKKAAAAEALVEKINGRLADPAVYGNPDEAARLNRGLAEARTELEQVNDAWAEAAVELDEITESFQAEPDD